MFQIKSKIIKLKMKMELEKQEKILVNAIDFIT
jgi:hypothetical protein